jgi:hypothetical protein
LVEEAAPERVLTLGDNAYDSGTLDQFEKYYDPTWGRFKAITLPSPGNHEYRTHGEGYYGYFAVPPYYAAEVCGWRILSLNSEIDLEPQVDWLRAELARRSGPSLAYWHRPRFSSAKQERPEHAAYGAPPSTPGWTWF